jgi:hypothetical protein
VQLPNNSSWVDGNDDLQVIMVDGLTVKCTKKPGRADTLFSTEHGLGNGRRLKRWYVPPRYCLVLCKCGFVHDSLLMFIGHWSSSLVLTLLVWLFGLKARGMH